MVGRSKLAETAAQREALAVLATRPDRPQADRARSILLTLSGWTSPRVIHGAVDKPSAKCGRHPLVAPCIAA